MAIISVTTPIVPTVDKDKGLANKHRGYYSLDNIDPQSAPLTIYDNGSPVGDYVTYENGLPVLDNGTVYHPQIDTVGPVTFALYYDNGSGLELKWIDPDYLEINEFNLQSYINTVAELKNLEPSLDGQVISVGQNTNGIGGGLFYADFSDTTSENNDQTTLVTPLLKRWKRSTGAVTADFTVKVGGNIDFDELNDAIKYLAQFNSAGNAICTIELQTAYTLKTGLAVSGENLGWIDITSIDAVVNLDASFPAVDVFLARPSAVLPTISILVDANNLGLDGVACWDNSSVVVSSGAGVINAGNRGIYLNRSSSSAVGCVFTGALNRNCWVTRGSILNAEQANFSGSFGSRAVYVSRASHLTIDGADITNAEFIGITVLRSVVMAQGADFSNSGTIGVDASNGSLVTANNSIFTDCGSHAAQSSGGATLNINESTITNSVGRSIRAVEGGVCVAERGVTITGCLDTIATVEAEGGLIYCNSIDITDGAGDALYCDAGGKIVSSNLTITTPSGRGVAATQGGEIIAHRATITTPTGNALFCSTGGRIYADDLNTSNCVDAIATVRCDSGKIEMSNSTITAGAGAAIKGDNAIIVASDTTITNPALQAVRGTLGSNIIMSDCAISAAGSDGVLSEGGSKINVVSGSVTGSTSGNDLRVQTGSYIHANSCVTTNSVGSDPDITDVNGVSAFNTIEPGGIVWG